MGNGSSRKAPVVVVVRSGNQPSSGDIGRRTVRHITVPEVGRPRSPTPPPDGTQLKILSLDLKKDVNAEQHHTDEIDGIKGLVIRRGQAFTFLLKLNRSYDDSTDQITFDFKIGSNPVIQKRTRVYASTGGPSSGGKQWEVKILDKTEDTLTVSITSDPDALVGEYSLTVHAKVAASVANYAELQSIYLLFNPWCEEDQVYLQDDKELEEYVLNEQGLIWYGNSAQPASRPWGFNQFEEKVFEAVMYLLKKHVKEGALGSPVLVARTMSAAVNFQDDNGVLSGKWGGDYSPHTRPTKWTGSQAILEKHLESKAPVRYGQCWVFSGVLTTVLRCLGIPSRSVTNYSSAHDTDSSLTIDKHFSPDGTPADFYNNDSVWNFHVWNECWMTRPDLPAGFGGWQAVDATPQETSEGIFCTGPCSVKAIKDGHVYYPYDAKFVFAEVNGDIVNWEVKSSGDEFIRLRVKYHVVGRNISTKEVGKKGRRDLTLDYKYKDGSDEERAAVKLAAGYGTKPFVYDVPDTTDDVDMSVEVTPNVYIGADFDIPILVENKSSEQRTISINFALHSCYYTGVIAKQIKTEPTRQLILGPNESKRVIYHVDSDEYLDKLVDQTGLKMTVVGHVEETGQDFGDEEDFRLRTPDLEVKLSNPDEAIQFGRKIEVEISLTNPLEKKLTHCEFDIEGRGLLAPTNIQHGVIEAKDTTSRTVSVYPVKAGKRTLVITFESDQLSQVTGELELDIQR
ncbi:protein-glutamine gamma-glutamyltransferase K-like [Asterias amurensis]|uniref:protein-glutamine gamma-glutamyltransferase K-like n=1 Tax=Asterias amurensis TaxID=7602 RepID=UPI003AB50322